MCMRYIEGHDFYWCMLDPDYGRSQSLCLNLPARLGFADTCIQVYGCIQRRCRGHEAKQCAVMSISIDKLG